MIRHMFAGGNTPDGFFSYFYNILPLKESRKTIYMKGGSGTGKSTFMKNVGKIFEEKKYDIEYFHCSNDVDSLDGVCIPKLKAAIIDATAPHVQDPVIPVAADEILNVAVCLNEEGLKPYSNELQQILSEKKKLIQMAYGYLHAAYAVYNNSSFLYEKLLNKGTLNKIIYDTLKITFSGYDISDSVGKHRKLFASAITPSGFVNFSEYLFAYENLTVFHGEEGLGSDFILLKILEAASERGLETEGYYSPLSPYRLEHLIIPELQCCFVTSNSYHENRFRASKEISLYDLCRKDSIEKYRDIIKYNHEMFSELAEKAMSLLKESGEFHNRVEEIYISNMNFDQLNSIYNVTIDQLMKLE